MTLQRSSETFFTSNLVCIATLVCKLTTLVMMIQSNQLPKIASVLFKRAKILRIDSRFMNSKYL